MSRKKEYQEEEVLDKAMHTFWANGYENTSLRMLEKEMGINQFSIYSSFNSKNELFVKALKKYRMFVKTFFLKDFFNSEGRIDDVRQFFTEYGHGVQSGENPHGCLMMNTGMEVGNQDSDITEQLTLHFNFLKDTFFTCFEKMKLHDELPADFDSRKYSVYLLGSLQGLSLFAKLNSKKEVDDYIEAIFSVFN